MFPGFYFLFFPRFLPFITRVLTGTEGGGLGMFPSDFTRIIIYVLELGYETLS